MFATRSARAAVALLLAGCASGGQPASGRDRAPAAELHTQERVSAPWAVRTRRHVDLWLHGFAMLQEDTTLVPYFRRGYQERMSALKNEANIVTQLETNGERLRARFAENPDLIGAQFLALYFSSWEELQRAIELALRAEGDPRRTNDQQARAVIAMLASLFPANADREWLRLFTASLRDENDRFYRTHWQQAQRDRAPVLARLDSLWEYTYRPKLLPYLNNTQLGTGDFLLSLPLDGEGRTVTGSTANTITTAFPETRDDVVEAIYVFAHEAISPVASVAVNDNTTPTEKRERTAERYSSAALVRGGAMVLERLAPELLDGYARYYLQAANAPAAGEPVAALERVFPLPDAIVAAMDQQLDLVLGGI